MRRLAIAAVLLVAACSHVDGGRQRSARGGATGRPPVALVVVDGLDARALTLDEIPALARARREARWCAGAHARAAMPARTNVNHATLATGVEPEAHGIIGNAYWGRGDDPPRKLGGARDFLTQTIFTLAARATPALRTAVAVGKPKLDLMFTLGAPGQRPPTAVWSPKDAADAGKDAKTGYAFDATTLAGARRLLDDRPAFLLVNLADVDRVSHGAGPDAPAARAARRATDTALAAFVDDVLRREEWRDGTIVVTADHGFAAVAHPEIDFDARLHAASLDRELVAVADGGVAHVYARRPRAPDSRDALAAGRRLALGIEGVAEALYLAPNPADGGDEHTLGHVHPDWHVAHERSGDILLVAERGWVLAEQTEARLAGNHGGPGELDVPLIVLGGTRAEAGDACRSIRAADVGATLVRCLGLPDVAAIDGGVVRDADRGHVLPGACGRTEAGGAAS